MNGKMLVVGGLWLVAALMSGSSLASTSAWTGAAGDGMWTNRLNWSDNTLPGSGDGIAFRRGGSYRINVDGVNVEYGLVYVGSATSLTGDKVTIVGGSLIASCVYVYTNNAFYVEGADAAVTFRGNSCAYNGEVGVRNGAKLTVPEQDVARKLGMYGESKLVLDRGNFIGRIDITTGCTVKMNKGSVFTTMGDQMIKDGVTGAIFDVTGGKYVVGPKTTDKGFPTSVELPNRYGFADKLDEFVVEYTNGVASVGRLIIQKPGITHTTISEGGADVQECIALAKDSVFRTEHGDVEGKFDSQQLAANPYPWMTRAIEIGSGADVRLNKSSSSAVQFAARQLTVGDGAKVELPNSSAYLMAYEAAEIGASAKIVLTNIAESGLVSGTTYPILMGAPNGDDLSAGQFETGFTNGSPWHIACIGQYAWLSDTNAPVSTATTATWTGRGDNNNFNNSENWTTTENFKKVAAFTGDKRTVVNIDAALTISKRMDFDKNCAAPFVFTNNMISFSRGGGDGGITSCSKYPVVYWTKIRGRRVRTLLRPSLTSRR